MNLNVFIEKGKEDSNLFWRLSSGEHQNLLDEAIEKLEIAEANNRSDEAVVSQQKGEHESLKDYILKKEKEGKVVLMTIQGLVEVSIDNFIKQPAEGILYDLNRDKVTVLTFIEDKKWVNDYAVGLVITKLKALLSD